MLGEKLEFHHKILILRPSVSLPLHLSKPIEPIFLLFVSLEYIIEHYLWYIIT